MELPELINAKLISRYKRFFADVELENGQIVTAHCSNTGAMTGCWENGALAQISMNDNPNRKLKWTLERVKIGTGWVGVNTHRTNHFIADFIKNNQIKTLRGYTSITREPVYLAPGYKRSRFDLLLKGHRKRDCYIEIKNTTLFHHGAVKFPDSITLRGKKHLKLLEHAIINNFRGVILFAVNRSDGKIFQLSKDIDYEYYLFLKKAYENGVEILPLRIHHTQTSVICGEPLPFSLN